MMKNIFNDRTPGWIGKILLIIITSFWCYWSVGEMYHEGWWGAYPLKTSTKEKEEENQLYFL
jgi:hypothetical protein